MAPDSFVDNSLLCGITHDIEEELFHFANRRPWQSGLYSKLLVKAEDLRMLLIAMDAGAVMKEHHADGSITIHVLRGALSVRIHGEPQALQVGQVLTLAPRMRHDVEAHQDSAFLVTISWPSGQTLQSLPHRGYGS